MNLKIKLFNTGLLLAVLMPAVATPAVSTPNASSTTTVSATKEISPSVTTAKPKELDNIQQSSKWQPLLTGSTADSKINLATTTHAAQSGSTQQSPQNSNASLPAGNTQSASPSSATEGDDGFMNDAIKRNQALNQLEYQRSELTLQQDISQLEVSIKKNRSELVSNMTNGAEADSNNYSSEMYSSSANRASIDASSPKLIEIFIKQGQAQAAIFFQGMPINVSVGKKFGPYTVIAIDQSTVTLATHKHSKHVILHLDNSY